MSAINVTPDQLFQEIGRLQVECRLRAENEDALTARIVELERAVRPSSDHEHSYDQMYADGLWRCGVCGVAREAVNGATR